MSDTVRTAVTAWVALLVLLAITAASSRFDLGWANLAINLVVAAAKAAVILAWFMHLKGGALLTRLVAAAMIFWLAILYGLVVVEYATR